MSGEIGLRVNGVKHKVEAEPDRMLLGVLRDELGLTGSKYGCGEGQCGACTVVLDGRAVRSCRLSVADCADKPMTTIEGLAHDGKLHPLQQAFLDVGALQCGYCTAGMIMNAYALLAKRQAPSRQQVIQAMEGNICRCGTYQRILQAIDQAAKSLQGGAV
ncbi:MAG TPA: (2Fe-2S)-binding protein [Planctomycetaceae bacterium]|jgi:aerobic-type carbon monoxide dehydrogenase small subunit (CoxS/CutS family)|nr:(2Fe-2S)-binding protein [Planctomycetaceae bacterium]